MKSMAVRGTIIILAAVALIGAVVALRVAQASQHDHEYTISVTPDKVLEQASGTAPTIMVEVTRNPAFEDHPTLYLYIANEDDGDGCDFDVANCANDANMNEDGMGDLPRVDLNPTQRVFPKS